MNVELFSYGKIKIYWRYYDNLIDSESYYSIKTACVVTSLESYEVISVGETYCSRKDQFSKEKGRKISLERAIKNFNRKERAKVWLEYFNSKKINSFKHHFIILDK